MRFLSLLGLVFYLPWVFAQTVFSNHSISTGQITIDGRVVSGVSGVMQGSGKRETRVHDIASFNRVTVSGGFDFKYTQGAPKITISGDDNIISALVFDLHDGHLNLSISRSYSTEQSIVVHVSSSVLNDLEVNGAGDVTVERISSPNLTVKLSGTSDFSISGIVDRFSLQLSGSAEMNGHDLHTRQANLNIIGSGDCSITVTDQLKVTIAGSGDVTYYGYPKTVAHEITGVGELISGD